MTECPVVPGPSHGHGTYRLVNGVVLTGREYDVLATYCQAGSRKATAHALRIGENTVRHYTARILAKFDAASMVEAYTKAGWLRVPVEAVA